LINQTSSDIPRVNQSSLDRKSELDVQWKVLEERALHLMETDIPDYNRELWNAGIGALRIGD
jgi:hypothetical protein